MVRQQPGIRDPYIRKPCVSYIDPQTSEWKCTAGKEVCPEHGHHVPCPYTHKKGKK